MAAKKYRTADWTSSTQYANVYKDSAGADKSTITLTATPFGLRVRRTNAVATGSPLVRLGLELITTPQGFRPMLSNLTLRYGPGHPITTNTTLDAYFTNSANGSQVTKPFNLTSFWAQDQTYTLPNTELLGTDGSSVSPSQSSSSQIILRVLGDADFYINFDLYDAGDPKDQIPVGYVYRPADASVTLTSHDESLQVDLVADPTKMTGVVRSLLIQTGDATTDDFTLSPVSSRLGSLVSIRYPSAGLYPLVSVVGDPAADVPVTSSYQVATPSGTFQSAFYFTSATYPSVTTDGSASVGPAGDPISSYTWNWGDGTTSTGATAAHTYARAGTYTVSLTTKSTNTGRTSVSAQAVTLVSPIATTVADFPVLIEVLVGTKLVKTATGISYNWTQNEVASLTFTASTNWLSSVSSVYTSVARLDQDVVVRMNYGFGWFEPRNGRFVVTDERRDPLNPDKLVQVTCASVVSDLDDLYTPPGCGGPSYTKSEIKANYNRLFTNATPGAVLATYPFSYTAGVYLKSLTTDSSATADSKAVAWGKTLSNLSVPPDSSILSVLQGMAAGGYLDWFCQGNVLRVFNPGTSGMRSSSDVVPTLKAGLDVKAAPQDANPADSFYQALVLSNGQAPRVVRVTDTTSVAYQVAHYRGWKTLPIQADDVINNTQALAAATPTLEDKARARQGEFTRELRFYSGMPWLPYRDYQPGDTVVAPGADGKHVPLLVKGITFSQSDSGITASIALNAVAPIREAESKLTSLPSGGAASIGNVQTAPPSTAGGYIGTLVSAKVTNDNGTIDAGSTETVVEGKGSNGSVSTLSVGATTTAPSVYVKATAAYTRTTSSAANVNVATDGTLARSTSATKYKQGIEAQDYGDAILDVGIKTWYDLHDLETMSHWDETGHIDPVDSRPTRRHVGLIAEDVEGAGLEDLLVRDDAGELEGIQYDRVALLLIPIVRDLRDQLEARDTVLEQLLNRVAALEGNSVTDTTPSS